MAAREVLAIDLDGTVERVCAVPEQRCGLGWLPDGTLLVVSVHDRQLLRFDGTTLEVHADLRPLVEADLNDMVVDGRGRAYVTNFGYDAEAGATPRPASGWRRTARSPPRSTPPPCRPSPARSAVKTVGRCS